MRHIHTIVSRLQSCEYENEHLKILILIFLLFFNVLMDSKIITEE